MSNLSSKKQYLETLDKLRQLDEVLNQLHERVVAEDGHQTDRDEDELQVEGLPADFFNKSFW